MNQLRKLNSEKGIAAQGAGDAYLSGARVLSSSPISVALVLDHASVTGGAAKVAFDSALGLKQAGHRPIVFAAAGPIDPRLTEEGVEVVCLGQHDILNDPSRLGAAARGIWNFEAARRLEALLASLPRGRSVVHVHGWAKALSPSIARPIAASGLPAVCTLHEYFLFCPNGGFFNYNTSEVCQLEPMSGACLTTNCDSRSYPQKLWRCARHSAMSRVARLPQVFSDFIVISDLQDGIVRSRLPKGARVHRVPNPIEAHQLGRKSGPASGGFLFVGRIAREKGPLLFAEAARRAGVVPTYVGDGPIREELAVTLPRSAHRRLEDAGASAGDDARRAGARVPVAMVRGPGTDRDGSKGHGHARHRIGRLRGARGDRGRQIRVMVQERRSGCARRRARPAERRRAGRKTLERRL